jgi:ATP-dependent Lhr-like helicase
VSQLNTGQIIIGKEGERLLRKLDFYTSFVAPVDFDVINNDDSKRIGMIQFIPQVKHLLILAGRRWMVERVDDKTKNIYVTRVKSGGNISFASDVPEVDEIITRKMREIYMSSDKYTYVAPEDNGQAELAEAREFFAEKKLDQQSLVDNTWFTWAGAKVNRTISLMCKLYLSTVVPYNHLMIFDISREQIMSLLSHPKPKAEQLAALLQRNEKQNQKYDRYLSDSLLDFEYAHTYLDVDKAWDEIINFAKY